MGHLDDIGNYDFRSDREHPPYDWLIHREENQLDMATLERESCYNAEQENQLAMATRESESYFEGNQRRTYDSSLDPIETNFHNMDIKDRFGYGTRHLSDRIKEVQGDTHRRQNHASHGTTLRDDAKSRQDQEQLHSYMKQSIDARRKMNREQHLHTKQSSAQKEDNGMGGDAKSRQDQEKIPHFIQEIINKHREMNREQHLHTKQSSVKSKGNGICDGVRNSAKSAAYAAATARLRETAPKIQRSDTVRRQMLRVATHNTPQKSVQDNANIGRAAVGQDEIRLRARSAALARQQESSRLREELHELERQRAHLLFLQPVRQEESPRTREQVDEIESGRRNTLFLQRERQEESSRLREELHELERQRINLLSSQPARRIA